ncbi:MAG TPA: alpha/beta hydrolase family protein [Puia sp.]|nr:alpha/beta hydrolase family protein [Puia sp.]
MKYLLPVLLVLASATCLASQVDTIEVHSASMNKDIRCVIVRPRAALIPGHHPSRFPVIYLLHGWAGNYAQWLETAPQLRQEADTYGMLLVCPDGGYDSWYFDSPADPSIRYETFISKELVAYVDGHYPTIPDRRGRAITGLSMGGHGALYLAIRHPDIFGAAGATSGGVDFRPFINNWGIKKDLGDSAADAENYTVVHAVDALRNGELAITFDCGTGDFFLPVNRELHRKLLEEKIDHDYAERPGGHDGAYWKNSIDYQLLFFRKFFTRSQDGR